jgi:hypothetical protein
VGVDVARESFIFYLVAGLGVVRRFKVRGC